MKSTLYTFDDKEITKDLKYVDCVVCSKDIESMLVFLHFKDTNKYLLCGSTQVYGIENVDASYKMLDDPVTANAFIYMHKWCNRILLKLASNGGSTALEDCDPLKLADAIELAPL